MIKKKYTYYLVVVILLSFPSFCSLAQSIEITTNRNEILIGERIEYQFNLSNLPLQGVSVNLGIPDSLDHFEIIERSDFDSSTTNGTRTLRRKFVFTSFDSGSWYIPAFPVTITLNGVAQKRVTDSVLINVNYAKMDSTGALRDIKPIMEVEVVSYFWLYLVLTGIFLLILTIVIYRYLKKRAARPIPVLHSTLSPYDQAMNDLKALSAYDLADNSQIKLYHSELGFILRRYNSRVIEKNMLNHTTGDLLLKLKEQQLEHGFLTSVAQVLRIGDAVKFAKYIPAVSENQDSLVAIKNAIERLETERKKRN